MQAKEIFLQAIEVDDAGQREALVEEKCGEDDALKRKVHALLAANEDPESFLDQPAARFDVTATAFGKSNSSGLSDSSDHGRFLPGTQLADRYRIVSMLGRGGMGEVYRADDLRLGQTVALKFLPRELANHAKRLEYFHQEVKLARQISHPNICRVYDIGEVNGQPFLSMEYIDGEDLKTLLQRIGRLPKDKGVQIARQLCSGLAAAHAKGVLHRDLKPANIMVDGQGQVRITDFGLATVSTDGENVIGMSGTPGYMAPDQLLSGQTNVRTDIYSLGLILFEVFTGKPAHDASSLAELKNLHADSSSVLNASDLV
ncbi:MAG: serine/threonine-protein kinase, partial [Pirellulaceae bacterium]